MLFVYSLIGFLGRREGGFVMTYATLASVVKYPFSSSLAGKHGKFGFFISEENTFKKIAKELGIIKGRLRMKVLPTHAIH